MEQDRPPAGPDEPQSPEGAGSDSSGTIDEVHDRKAGGSTRARAPSGVEPHDRLAGGTRAALEPGDGAMRPTAHAYGEAPHDPGGDAADGRPERRASAGETQEPKRAGRSTRDVLRDNALTIGLAASSLALLAGGRGTGDRSARVTLADAFLPPAKVTEEKGVTWDLHMSDHERIDYFVEYLMGKNHDKTRTWLERIGKYGPIVQNELRARGMPEDLLYLTMIESGLDPNAYSRAHAAGLWQFIEETGKRYGLEVSAHVDERRDPVKATAAALTYLKQLHDRFDSWYLSAAGYNTGENRVGRLMRETTGAERGSDEGYWEIWDRLPSETRDYVPLMLAMGKIAKEPDRYGFHNLQYEQPLQFEQVMIEGGTRLADVARAANADPEVIYDLNPHLVKKMTPPNRRMAVRVPVGQGTRVAAAFNSEVVDISKLAD